ncbi:MAG: NAD(+) diphosphatase [Aestuariibacter sp.]
MIEQQPAIKADNQYYFFIFSGAKVLQHASQPGPILATLEELSLVQHYQENIVQVGRHQGKACLMVDLEQEQVTQADLELIGLRNMMMQEPEMFGVISRAWQVALFLRTHRFCGQCGRRMHNVQWELAMACKNCGHRCYPRISPCIIVAVRKGNKILLAQGKHHSNNMYSTLAGFVESGETLEQAVHREVKEEVGININNIRYFGSQPWPFPHSLMCGFLADWHSGDIDIDNDEIIAAEWFDVDKLPTIPPTFSIAGKLIAATLSDIAKNET